MYSYEYKLNTIHSRIQIAYRFLQTQRQSDGCPGHQVSSHPPGAHVSPPMLTTCGPVGNLWGYMGTGLMIWVWWGWLILVWHYHGITMALPYHYHIITMALESGILMDSSVYHQYLISTTYAMFIKFYINSIAILLHVWNYWYIWKSNYIHNIYIWCHYDVHKMYIWLHDGINMDSIWYQYGIMMVIW